jgi:guanyl-specific ribonuclease Sa
MPAPFLKPERSSSGAWKLSLPLRILLMAIVAVVLLATWLAPEGPGSRVSGTRSVPETLAPIPDKPAPTNPAAAPAAESLIVPDVVVQDLNGRTIKLGDVNLKPTLDRIAAGKSFPSRNDGSVFQNRPPPGSRQPLLPKQPVGYYHEYVLPTPGIGGPGPQRVILGRNDEVYYTSDHYASFIRIRGPPEAQKGQKP